MHRLAVLEMILDGQFEGKIYILQEDVTNDVVALLKNFKESLQTEPKKNEQPADELIRD